MSFPLFDLSGRQALVTGSSQGIGLAIAAGLAEHGAAIVLNSRDESKLKTAANRLRAAGHAVAVAPFDVTNAEAVQQGVSVIERDIGVIDILVNNAGMQFRTPLEEFPIERWEQLLKTNVSSVSLLKSPSGQGSGLPTKTSADDSRFLQQSVVRCCDLSTMQAFEAPWQPSAAIADRNDPQRLSG